MSLVIYLQFDSMFRGGKFDLKLNFKIMINPNIIFKILAIFQITKNCVCLSLIFFIQNLVK